MNVGVAVVVVVSADDVVAVVLVLEDGDGGGGEMVMAVAVAVRGSVCRSHMLTRSSSSSCNSDLADSRPSFACVGEAWCGTAWHSTERQSSKHARVRVR